MSVDRRFGAVPWVVLGVAVTVFMGWAVFPSSALYAEGLTPHRLLALAALLKLVYLLAGAAWAFACRDRLEADNPARPAWFLLSLGLLSTSWGSSASRPSRWCATRRPFPRSPTSSTCSATPS